MRNGIYVDKTGLIKYMNKVSQTDRMLVCSSRQRRFGKSFAAKMPIIELKWDKYTEMAIKQEEEQQCWEFAEKFKYKGNILLVGINYNTKNKSIPVEFRKYL